MKALKISGLAVAGALMLPVLLLSACITLTPDGQRTICEVIERALTVPEATLEASPAPRDRYAAVIALRYGLNGAPHDEARASAIMAPLTEPHSRMMSYWVAGTKKTPGHMSFMNITTYDINPGQVHVVENCLTLLTGEGEPSPAALDGGVCGGADNYRHLKDLWTRAAH
ncbi:hypothetical protein [Asticcacaulis solisilvae]|uniref:hypothetical protein n=1 Tax=Asticcacaulis solisilvae TaxID=1217274 RepID=UPI003FD889A4